MHVQGVLQLEVDAVPAYRSRGIRAQFFDSGAGQGRRDDTRAAQEVQLGQGHRQQYAAGSTRRGNCEVEAEVNCQPPSWDILTRLSARLLRGYRLRIATAASPAAP
jgi:hypothetical protein